MSRLATFLLLAAVAMIVASPADAKTKPKPTHLIVSANMNTMPPGLRKKAVCARLHVRDDIGNDGILEYYLTWKGHGWKGDYWRSAARFDGSRIVADRPVPAVALLAANGATQEAWAAELGFNQEQFDRTLCAAKNRRALGKGRYSRPLPSTARARYRSSALKARFPLKPTFALADDQATAAIFAAHWEALFGDDDETESITTDDEGSSTDEANDAACPPGTLINGVPC